MHPSMIARQANEIVEVLNLTKSIDDRHVPIHLEDVRARLDWMGFTLEDVVRAGIYRLGRVTAKIGRWAEIDYTPPVYLTTQNWRQEIQEALANYGEYLDWKHRTYLKCLLTQGGLCPHELSYANSLMEMIYNRMADEEEEVPPDNDAPPPPSQLNLGV